VLMGFVVLNDTGLRAMLFYLVTYYLVNLGAFLVVMVVANSTGREDLDGYRGLAWRGGAVPAVAMAIFLFSLAGIPPLAGFVGKFYLFAAAYDRGWIWLIIVGVVATAVSLYYYLGVIRAMYFRPSEELQLAPVAGGSPPRELVLQTAVTAAIAVTVGSFFAVRPLIDAARHATEFLFL